MGTLDRMQSSFRTACRSQVNCDESKRIMNDKIPGSKCPCNPCGSNKKFRTVCGCPANPWRFTDGLYDKTVLVSGAGRVVVKLKTLEKMLGPSI